MLNLNLVSLPQTPSASRASPADAQARADSGLPIPPISALEHHARRASPGPDGLLIDGNSALFVIANPSCLLSILLFAEILGNKTVSLEHPA